MWHLMLHFQVKNITQTSTETQVCVKCYRLYFYHLPVLSKTRVCCRQVPTKNDQSIKGLIWKTPWQTLRFASNLMQADAKSSRSNIFSKRWCFSWWWIHPMVKSQSVRSKITQQKTLQKSKVRVLQKGGKGANKTSPVNGHLVRWWFSKHTQDPWLNKYFQPVNFWIMNPQVS